MADTSTFKHTPFRFNTPAWSNALGWSVPPYYGSIQCADVTGTGQASVMARSSAGIVGAYFCKELGNRMIRLPYGPKYSDAEGWASPQYCDTIQYADIDGDGRDELIARDVAGIQVHKLFDPPVDLVPEGMEMIRPSFMSWGELPRGPAWADRGGWNNAKFYRTIQTADINGDGKAELIARDARGIVAYSYDPKTKKWVMLPRGPSWAGDDWSEPSEYLTIQTADLEGIGRAAVFGRSKNGIRAAQFNPEPDDPTKGTWKPVLKDGPQWTNAGAWGMEQFYSTIQAADFDGNGKAILVARSASNVYAERYDRATNTWEKLADGPDWGGNTVWAQPPYFSTIQAADFNGDGKAILIGRAPDGMCGYGYSSDANKWTQIFKDGPLDNKSGFSHASYYETIQTADIDGDGKNELIVRNNQGITAYRYDQATNVWSAFIPNMEKTPFPAYTGDPASAYFYISRKLLPNAQDPNIRTQYAMAGNPTLWIMDLKQMVPDPTVSDAVWNEVKSQLLLEFAAVQAAQTYFGQSKELVNYLQSNRSIAVESVLGHVDMTSNQSGPSPLAATLTSMFLGILNAIAIGASDGVGVAAGVFGSVMEAAMSSDPHYGTTSYQKASELDSWIETQFRGALTAAVTYEQEVLTDWGLLRAIGKLAGGGGPWERSATYVGDAELVSYKPFKLWLYKQLMPFKYQIYSQGGLDEFQVHQLMKSWQIPDHAAWRLKVGTNKYDLYAVLNLDANGNPSTACMNDIWHYGAAKIDFYMGRNGWDKLRRKHFFG